jgi:anti-sigma-K factor RskA
MSGGVGHTTNGGTNPERERLAAEYVVGLLQGDEQREAERLAETDPRFQAAVAQWQARFAELDQTAAPLPTSDLLWNRIETGLETPPALARAEDRAPAIVPSPVAAFTALWRSLQFWRVAGLAGALASLLLAVGVGVLATRASREPVLIAVLLTDQNRPAAVVHTFADGQAELVPFEGMEIPAGRSLEVWAIPGPNQNPISVGVVTQARSSRLDLQRVPNLRPDQVFAISVEPPQGSPSGLPTGPVLMKGTTTTAL